MRAETVILSQCVWHGTNDGKTARSETLAPPRAGEGGAHIKDIDGGQAMERRRVQARLCPPDGRIFDVLFKKSYGVTPNEYRVNRGRIAL